MNIFKRLRANMRLRSGFCPACNSDAPEMYDCKVCEAWNHHNRPTWPPPKEEIEKWRVRYFVGNSPVVKPLSLARRIMCRIGYHRFVRWPHDAVTVRCRDCAMIRAAREGR